MGNDILILMGKRLDTIERFCRVIGWRDFEKCGSAVGLGWKISDNGHDCNTYGTAYSKYAIELFIQKVKEDIRNIRVGSTEPYTRILLKDDSLQMILDVLDKRAGDL